MPDVLLLLLTLTTVGGLVTLVGLLDSRLPDPVPQQQATQLPATSGDDA